ncbi:MAG: TIGR02391 family protein [Terriglobia bacterium]
MDQSLQKLSPDEIRSLPIDRLGILVLKHLITTNEWNSHNFLQSGRNQRLPESTLGCWSEGLNWLVSKNLVARGTPTNSDPNAIFITRLGKKVLEAGLEPVRAAERLDVALHASLERVKSQFLLGEYELAAFAAMREVEIRVRELSCANSSLVGVKLMRKSFGEGGKLADSELEPGERTGIMELFAGAIGTFKNPPSHRQVDYANPTEASEVVLLADLLMRVLDRVKERLANSASS